jgi:selenoprotein W-related protein
MAELLKAFEYDIKSIGLIPSDGGAFEVTLDGKLIYSKLKTRRHANPGEIAGLIGGKA